MKTLAAISLLFLLCACESAEEKRAKWIAWCVQSEFSEKQCGVLYALKESSDEAQAQAQNAAAMNGLAIGLAAGSTGRK